MAPSHSPAPNASRPRIKIHPKIAAMVKKNGTQKIIDNTVGIKKKKRGNPQWQKGVVTNPNGRPKGSPNKFSIAQYKAASANGQELPLPFMLRLMRDERKSDELRLSAGIAAAPYLHRKMPIGIEQMPGRYGSLTAEQLRKLPTPALQQLLMASHTFYKQLVNLGIAQPAGEVIDVEPA